VDFRPASPFVWVALATTTVTELWGTVVVVVVGAVLPGAVVVVVVVAGGVAASPLTVGRVPMATKAIAATTKRTSTTKARTGAIPAPRPFELPPPEPPWSEPP
jgi:hypothetical protein